MLQETNGYMSSAQEDHDSLVTARVGMEQENRPKIIHSAETAVGGVGAYMNTLCTLTDEFENIVLVHEGETEFLDQPRYIETYAGKRRGLSRTISQCKALLQLYDRENPDIVFLHSTFSLAPLLMLSVLRPSSKIIYCAHGWAVSQYLAKGSAAHRVVAAIEGSVPALAKRVVNISKHDFDLAKNRKYRGRHVMVENAVKDLRQASGLHSPSPQTNLDKDKLNLLFVGRHDSQKGLDILIDAFRDVQDTRPDIALHVIGASVRSKEVTIEWPKNVNVVGWVDNSKIDEWYKAVDALVVPSRWEGFGLVVAEAFRNGTPVIASDRGALPYLVEAGKTGEVFQLSVENLTKLLKNSNKTNLRQMRQACRSAYEERFSPLRFKKEITSLYRDVIEGK